MAITNEEAIIEAVLFASGYPVKFDTLAEILEKKPDEVRELVNDLAESYEGRGIELVILDDECQLCTRTAYEEKVRNALGLRRGTKLSQPLLEVLSIVAYRQPVTRAYIEQVRGVDCAYSITSLIDKSMIEAQGHLDLPGRPTIYGTTADFLRVFGLSSLEELPPIQMFDSVVSANEDAITALDDAGTVGELDAPLGDASGEE